MFNDYEKSDENGQPVELYEFMIDAEAFRFTSSESTISSGGVDYRPVAISRNGFGQAMGERPDAMVVSLPTNEDFVKRFILTPPGIVVPFTLRRFHLNDPDLQVKILFRGVVKSVIFVEDGHKAEVHSAPITSAFSRTIPRFSYSGLCNHMLYDARCKIDEHDPAWEKHLHISAVANDQITADGAGAFGADFFVAGFVESGNDFRQVIKQVGDVLTLQLPFLISPLGNTLRCLAGCKLRLTDCRVKFDNVLNFGGFPYTPQKNPFASGLD